MRRSVWSSQILQKIPGRVSRCSSQMAIAALCCSAIWRFGQEPLHHLERRNELVVVVRDGLLAGDVTDAADRRAAQLAHALGERVDGVEDGIGLLIEKEVQLRMHSGQVPVKVLGLDIGEGVGDQRIHGPDEQRRPPVLSGRSAVGECVDSGEGTLVVEGAWVSDEAGH